jgi:hypothetical protein
LCIQRPTEGNNDINHLALHNKMTQSACKPSTFPKEPNDITGYYFQNGPFGKAALEEPKEFNTSWVLTMPMTSISSYNG